MHMTRLARARHLIQTELAGVVDADRVEVTRLQQTTARGKLHGRQWPHAVTDCGLTNAADVSAALTEDTVARLCSRCRFNRTSFAAAGLSDALEVLEGLPRWEAEQQTLQRIVDDGAAADALRSWARRRLEAMAASGVMMSGKGQARRELTKEVMLQQPAETWREGAEGSRKLRPHAQEEFVAATARRALDELVTRRRLGPPSEPATWAELEVLASDPTLQCVPGRTLRESLAAHAAPLRSEGRAIAEAAFAAKHARLWSKDAPRRLVAIGDAFRFRNRRAGTHVAVSVWNAHLDPDERTHGRRINWHVIATPLPEDLLKQFGNLAIHLEGDPRHAAALRAALHTWPREHLTAEELRVAVAGVRAAMS